MDQRIENIIREKRFVELDAEERQLLEEWAKTEEEFDQLKVVFSSVDALNVESKEQMNPTVKQRLDVRFKERFDQRRLVWYNKLWVFLWPEETGFVKKPLIQLAAVGLLVAIVTPFLFVNDPASQQLAMNEENKVEQPGIDAEIPKEDDPNDSSGDKVVENEDPKTRATDLVKEKSTTSQEDKNRQEMNYDIKDVEMSAPKEEMVDRMESTDDLYLSDEVAESEPASPQREITGADQAPASEQQVFAGVVSSESREKSVDSDVNELTVKKVDQKETIDLLTALY